MILGDDTRFSPKLVKDTITELFILSESRGKEAAGAAVFYDGKENIHKESISARFLIRSKEYESLFSGITRPVSVLGHTRLATNGPPIDYNNSPLICGGIIGVHNGIVVNDEALWKEFPLSKRKCAVDSEVLFSLLDFFINNTKLSLIGSIQNVFRKIEGSASIAVFVSGCQNIILATNTGSLYSCRNIIGNVQIFSSELHILERVIKKLKFSEVIGQYNISQLKAGRGCLINIYTLEEDRFSLF